MSFALLPPSSVFSKPCSPSPPQVVKSVHYCEATKLFTSREYRDVTSLSGLPTGAQYPTKVRHWINEKAGLVILMDCLSTNAISLFPQDDNGNLLTTEYGLCVYKDNQVSLCDALHT